MSSCLQRIRWRVTMSCGRPRVEHFVLLFGFLCVATILTSFFVYEKGVDTSSAVEQRRRKMEKEIEDYVLYHQERKVAVRAVEMEMARRKNLSVKELNQEQLNNVNQSWVIPPAVDSEYQPLLDDGLEPSEKVEDDANNRAAVAQDVQQQRFVNNSLLNRRRSVMIALGNIHPGGFNDTARLPLKKKAGRRRKTKTKEEIALGDLQSDAYVKVYTAEPDPRDKFECLKLNIKPTTIVCLHNLSVDVHVSQHIHDVGIWEPYIVRMYQNLLFTEPDLGVYDIGSHVGQYSLLAATMGHKVVAVDPYTPNLARVRQAMQLNNLTGDRIILVRNAISDERETFELSIPSDNQGGAHLTDQDADRFCDEPSCPPHAQTIFMDDLLAVTNFKRAIIKIDIEGHEHRAFAQSAKLFENVRILYIFMEWIKLRGYYGSEADDSEDKRGVFGLIRTLTERGYTACGLVLLDRLDPEYWYGWPDDIVWQHKDATFV